MTIGGIRAGALGVVITGTALSAVLVTACGGVGMVGWGTVAK
jgi:hypothetical protein